MEIIKKRLNVTVEHDSPLSKSRETRSCVILHWVMSLYEVMSFLITSRSSCVNVSVFYDCLGYQALPRPDLVCVLFRTLNCQSTRGKHEGNNVAGPRHKHTKLLPGSANAMYCHTQLGWLSEHWKIQYKFNIRVTNEWQQKSGRHNIKRCLGPC